MTYFIYSSNKVTNYILNNYYKPSKLIKWFGAWNNEKENNEIDPIYQKSCIDLFEKLRFPNLSLFFNQPLKEPPADLLDEFTMNGKMPITKWWYFNDLYSDSKSFKTYNFTYLGK